MRMHEWVLRHWQRLLALVVCILVPLLVFGEIAEDVHERTPFVWEDPLMQAVRDTAPPGFRQLSLALSFIGSAKGMIPVVIVLLWLFWRKSRVMAEFFLLSVGGAMLLNLGAKLFFQRTRPELLERFWQESDYSFPSGHATMAMALVAALGALLWRTPWRAPLITFGLVYVFLMGAARVYVGVHYPTDVIGGAMAGLVWVGGISFIYWRRLQRAQEHALRPASAGQAPDPHPSEVGDTTS